MNAIEYTYSPFYNSYDYVTVKIINLRAGVRLELVDTNLIDWTNYKDKIIESFLKSFNDNYERGYNYNRFSDMIEMKEMELAKLRLARSIIGKKVL